MLNKIDKWLGTVTKYLDIVSRILLMVMVCFLCVNMILRPIWKPLIFAYDLACLTAVSVIALCLPYCIYQSGLLKIDIIVKKFSEKAQKVIFIIGDIVAMLGQAFMMYCEYRYLILIINQHKTSETVHIPYLPFAIAMVIGCTFLFFILIFDIIKKLAGGDKE